MNLAFENKVDRLLENITKKNTFYGQYVQMSRVFVNGTGDRDSIPGRVIPKTQKMVLETALLNTQQYPERDKRPTWEKTRPFKIHCHSHVY